jgi:hypothetical protein
MMQQDGKLCVLALLLFANSVVWLFYTVSLDL